jgi:23S rRNA (guanosine2251-2'-O)-methyltransferase
MIKLNAKQLRQKEVGKKVETGSVAIAKNEIYIILDDVLDTYNIGGIFRLCEAAGIKKLYLCGGTETPPNPRIKKSSINTTDLVDWEYSESAVDAIKDLRLKIKDIQIIAVEQAKDSADYTEFEYKKPLALVVGNESYGVLPETLKHVDAIVELPMFGVNISLNVMESTRRYRQLHI